MEQIGLEKVSVVFQTHQGPFKAIDNVSFSLEKGENISFIGESGSGKSTIAKLLIGLIKPTKGKVEYDSTDVSGESFKQIRKYRKHIQSVFQDASGTLNPGISTYKNLEEGLINLTDLTKEKRKEEIQSLSRKVGLKEQILNTPVRQLSGGEQRRLSLVRALAVKPDFLIMDEMTSGLDLLTAEKVFELLDIYQKERKISYIFITHKLSQAKRMARSIYELKNGSIYKKAKL